MQQIFAVGIRNPEDWNPESTMVLESGIHYWYGIRNPLWYGIRNTLWYGIRNTLWYGIRNTEAGIRNTGPSWILLHGATDQCFYSVSLVRK